MTLAQDVDAGVLRRFNRVWSQRVGLLQESYLGLGRSLGSSRLLFEMGPDGASVLELRRRLGLDSGYVSRLLHALESDGLVRVTADPHDARRRLAVPTAEGRRTIARLNDRSEQMAVELVRGLDADQQRRLAGALATAERLIRVGSVEVVAVDAASRDARTAVGRYFAEIDERFPETIDPATFTEHDLDELSAPHGCFLVARSGDRVVACGGLRRFRRTVGEVKRMWVDPDWRGHGLATRLLHALEREAARLGYREIYLDTHASLVEAQAMYRKLGYHEIERYNDNPHAAHWFAKALA